MGLCHSKEPSVNDEETERIGCFERRALRKRKTNHPKTQLSLPAGKQLNTTSHGSSTISIGPANGPTSCCSQMDTTRSAVSAAFSTERDSVEETENTERHNSENPEPSENQLNALKKPRRPGVEDEEKLEIDNIVSTSEEWNESPLRLDEVPLTLEEDEQDSEIFNLMTSLKSSSIFHDLDEKILQRIASMMQLESFNDGDVIIRQGEMPRNTDCMYCVYSGEVILQISGTQDDGRDTIIKKSGWLFGDISLLFNSSRSASVIASGECELYSLDRVHFINLMKNVPKIRLLRFLRKLPFLKSVSDNKLVIFGSQVTTRVYQEGDLILTPMLNNNKFYIIRKGNVNMVNAEDNEDSHHSQQQQTSDLLSRGHFFGVDEEIQNSFYATTNEVEVVIVEHQVYQKLGNISLYMKLIEDSVVSILNDLGTVDISSIRLGDLVNQNLLNTAKEGDLLFKQGQALNHLFLIVKGKITTSAPQTSDSKLKEKSTVKISHGTQYFGEKWWTSSTCDADIKVASNRFQYLKIPHKILSQAAIQSSGRKHGPKISDRVLYALPVVDKNEKLNIQFYDLTQHRVVGEGQYGKVRLVVHKHTKQRYALKVINKSAIKDLKTVEHVIMERKILSKLSGENFLVGFHGAFQDDHSLYLLMDWIPGGELFSRITLSGMLPESHAIFYAANVVLAFSTMHRLDIIYRDLKPENILIDSNGYLRLSDYGFATVSDSTALTLCGTPDYQAPEIITRRGAHKASDYWALGVLIFEMLTGDAPFKSLTDDPWDTYRRILSGRFYIPDYVSSSAASLITALLQVDLTKRLGYQSTADADVKSHPWFRNVNWEKLENQKARAPFIPHLTSSLDTSCFDHYDNSTSASVPSLKHNFFTRDHQWAHLWSWIENF